ncbi:MAG: ParB/RepB/Spo0J family partition protein [Candidatus Cloacimonetes bacterium]|nr:ParB/RepB/Spo0J family partition protein [Candidatus Cloacimonadota bacterium]
MTTKGKFIEKGKNILSKTRPENLSDFLSDEKRDYQVRHIYYLAIDKIKPNPQQPRQYFNQAALEELSASIKQKGVLQPVLVRSEADDNIILIAGERRWRAARMAGLKEVPALFIQDNPLEISLIENLQRENLQPLEEAEALGRMVSEYKYTQEKLALVIGKARTTVTEILSLNRLPEAVKKECQQLDLPRRTLVELARQESEKKMQQLLSRIRKDALKSDAVRQLSRSKKAVAPAEQLLKKTRGVLAALQEFEFGQSGGKAYLELMQELKSLRDLLDDLLS